MTDTDRPTSEQSEQTDQEGLLPLDRRTYLLSVAGSAGATGGAAGGVAATSSVSQNQPDTEQDPEYPNSWVGYGRGEYGSGLYGDVGPPSLQPYDSRPTDPDTDGRFEDVDGSGSFDIFDVQALFNELESEEVQRYAPFFDYDESGSVDIFDVQALFNELD